jgi:DNA-directed RNA polymerase subunit M/transcription elongation factor TFIIS
MFGSAMTHGDQEALWNSLSPDRSTRAAEIQRLRFYLSINGEFLLSNYSPTQLVGLSCDELAHGSEVARGTQALAQEWTRYEEMLQQPPPSLAQGRGIVCKKCRRSDQITIVSSQRRSADEGMSHDAECACGHHWHFSS